MNLQKKYSREDFLDFVKSFVPGFDKDVRKVKTDRLKVTSTASYLGESPDLDLAVFELKHTSSSDARVTLATEGFRIMKDSANYRALVAYIPEGSNEWRLSLMTATPEKTGKGKVSLKLSNPKRYSFFLGESAKINTPHKFLIKQGPVSNFEDLLNRFSLEVVNKEFYKQISENFIKLVGGTLGTGRKERKYKALLRLPSVGENSQTSLEFGVRLIGRIIFCWFLREKKSSKGEPLMPKKLLSLDASKKHSDYYHKVLEPIFFEVLNKPVKSRDDEYTKNSFADIPYLNGGLFSPHEDDFFSYSEGRQAINHNTVVVPDGWFKELFETLETYNFTIDENTSFDEELSIDPEMLGRIFENLLAEINPETGESARKSTGSYYTPRVIVDYMVDESLVLYLKQKTGVGEEKIRAVVSYDLTDDTEYPLSKDEKTKIVDALESLTLLDPACGSGAFPIGALQKIVFILQQLDPNGHLWFTKQLAKTPPELRRVLEREFENKNFDYIRKLGIIRENIYGVDIQPIATEISRLRCFLTLIVDERVDDKLENRGIEPLPNLDFKFVTANSLIKLPKMESPQQSMFDDYQGINQLKQIRDQYFTASGIEREQLKTEFVTQQKRLVDQLIQEHGWTGAVKADLTRKLTDWEPFTHKPSDWFDPEWMFGHEDGFDIVIANPPYISHVNYKNADKSVLRKLYKTYSGRADIYVIFYERGIDLLGGNGVLVFITPNKFFRAGYGSKLRLHLAKNTRLYSIVDFGDSHVFDATTYPAVTLLQAGSKEKYEFSYRKVDDLSKSSFYENTQAFSSDYLGDHLWSFVDGRLEKIWKKIKRDSVDMKSYIRGEFYRGIVTGLNEAFVISKGQKDQLIEEDPLSEEIIKPYLKGRDVKRWRTHIQSYVIFTYHGVDISKYPAIEKYLLPYKSKLLKRATSKNHEWYELQQPQTGIFENYEKTKIVSTDIAKRCEFTIDSTGSYIDATIFCIPRNDKYLLGLLNSTLLESYYRSISSTIRGDFLRFKKIYLDLMPIKNCSSDQKEKVVSTVNNILSSHKDEGGLAQVTDYEKRLDQLVYDIYSITKDEIEIIEKS